jgi:serine/threonine-protein kinase RsbW
MQDERTAPRLTGGGLDGKGRTSMSEPSYARSDLARAVRTEQSHGPGALDSVGQAVVDRVGKTYPAHADSVSQARANITGWLRAGGTDELMTGDIAVATSEACNNVVVHAYRHHGTDGSGHPPLFRVVAERWGEGVTVTVADSGCGMTPRADSPGLGLGLALMTTLTDHLEIRSGEDGTGTVVAMLFTATGARDRTL